MNVPYISLTLARRYVTELVRSPRVMASLTKSGPRPVTNDTTGVAPRTSMTVRRQPIAHA